MLLGSVGVQLEAPRVDRAKLAFFPPDGGRRGSEHEAPFTTLPSQHDPDAPVPALSLGSLFIFSWQKLGPINDPSIQLEASRLGG